MGPNPHLNRFDLMSPQEARKTLLGVVIALVLAVLVAPLLLNALTTHPRQEKRIEQQK